MSHPLPALMLSYRNQNQNGLFDSQASTPCFSKHRLILLAKRLVDIFVKYPLDVLFIHGKDFHRIREIILAF